MAYPLAKVVPKRAIKAKNSANAVNIRVYERTWSLMYDVNSFLISTLAGRSVQESLLGILLAKSIVSAA